MKKLVVALIAMLLLCSTVFILSSCGLEKYLPVGDKEDNSEESGEETGDKNDNEEERQQQAKTASYKVEYYYEKVTKDGYEKPQTVRNTAKIGSTAKIEPETKDGFTLDKSKSVLSGTVSDDDQLVLKVYYNRDYTIVARGTCGTSVEWLISTKGDLIIHGSGEMSNLSKNSGELPWYGYADQITGVVIEEGVTTVGDYAFNESFGKIERIELANTVTKIGKYAFYKCIAVKEVTVPGSVGYIGEYAFRQMGAVDKLLITFENTEKWLCGGNMVDFSQFSDAKETGTALRGTEYVGVWEKIDKAVFVRQGNKVIFGSYPSAKVTDDDLASTLSSKAGTLPTSNNSKKWSSYGYYLNGGVMNYMWYIDLEEGGEKYRGVYFTSYRPYKPDNSPSAGNSFQSNNGYSISTVYWFKYEPIYWTILEEDTVNGTALVLCDMIIDSQAFDYNSGAYDNNYADSTIRKWLNETFYNTAFNDLQKSLILITTVDNSEESTGDNDNIYACDDTNDKIFLPSFGEVTNDEYGFSLNCDTDDTARRKLASDYAKSQGALISTDSNYIGNAYWLLRSPNDLYHDYVGCVAADGGVDVSSVYYCYGGIVPALQIILADNSVSYAIECYRENEAGDGYEVFETVYKVGKIASTVTAEPDNLTGFALNSSMSVLSGTVSEDGSLVLKVYYDKVTLVASGVCGDNVQWKLESDGILTISGAGAMYNFSKSMIEVPWYNYSGQITGVVVKEGVTSVGDFAFNEVFTGIESIELPSTLVTIGKYAFYKCGAVKELAIPAKVTSIGTYAFRQIGATDKISITFAKKTGWSCGGISVDFNSFADANAVGNALRGTGYTGAWVKGN